MPSLNIQIFDVGQGDGSFIVFPDGTTMLVDLGMAKKRFQDKIEVTYDSLIAYFQNHTKFGKGSGKTLDYLVLTHGDIDHYNVIKQFVEKFDVRITNLLYGGRRSDYGSKSDLISALIKRQEQPINVIQDTGERPQVLGNFGGAQVFILALDAPCISGISKAWRKNTGSVVLQIKYARQSVILSGDATVDTEEAMLKNPFFDLFEQRVGVNLLKSDILKVGHHGSARTSIRPSWIAKTNPKYIFISADRHGRIGYFSGKEKKEISGHRLPQELCIDIIRANAPDLVKDTIAHTYVSAYDKNDYTDYVNPDTGVKGFQNKYADKDFERRWINPSTTEGIFVTMAAMDKIKLEDGTMADQGVQYGIDIQDNGAINFTYTLET